jgi:hypothetical protein
MTGPVGSPYPGPLAMEGFATLALTIVARSAWLAYKRSRNAGGLHEYGAYIAVAILGVGFLIMMICAIWVHSTSTPNQ